MEAFPGGAAQGYTLEVGSSIWVLRNHRDGVGGEQEVKATFRKIIPNDLAGKEAVFKKNCMKLK